MDDPIRAFIEFSDTSYTSLSYCLDMAASTAEQFESQMPLLAQSMALGLECKNCAGGQVAPAGKEIQQLFASKFVVEGAQTHGKCLKRR
mmetsp:Transcript_24985/g.35224  ORF Transcript_24985/g.35224 Transcript_24985/m.35224 type:complete len:89 (-) Transcript_24985:551-817(-)